MPQIIDPWAADERPAQLFASTLSTPTPIILAATTPNFGADNASVRIPDLTFLQNPHRTAMLIDEIRFHATANAEAALLSTRCQFRIGRNELTNGWVPLQMFGKSINPNDCTNTSGATNPLIVASWKLPRPLYVPAGEVLIPNF